MTTQEDYLEWGRRLIESEDDIDYLTDTRKWRDFVSQHGFSEEQESALMGQRRPLMDEVTNESGIAYDVKNNRWRELATGLFRSVRTTFNRWLK